MAATLLVFDPTAPTSVQHEQTRRILDQLAGKVVGFLDNAKPNFNFLVDDLAELLVERYGVASIVKRAKRSASMPAPDDIVETLAGQCDFVITGSGD